MKSRFKKLKPLFQTIKDNFNKTNVHLVYSRAKNKINKQSNTNTNYKYNETNDDIDLDTLEWLKHPTTPPPPPSPSPSPSPYAINDNDNTKSNIDNDIINDIIIDHNNNHDDNDIINDINNNNNNNHDDNDIITDINNNNNNNNQDDNDDSKENWVKDCFGFSTSSSTSSSTTTTTSSIGEGNLSEKYVSNWEVSYFVCTYIRLLIPASMFGSKHNLYILFNAIKIFVALRKHETFRLSTVLQGFRIMDLDWLCKKNGYNKNFIENNENKISEEEFKYRKMIGAKFLAWVFEMVIVPTVQAHYYVTEHAKYKQRTMFYEKKIWNQIHDGAVKKSEKLMLKKIDENEAKEFFSQKNALGGFSYVRFVPKPNGTRNITNMARKLENTNRKYGSGSSAPTLTINKMLGNSFHVLKYEKDKLQHEDNSKCISLSKLEDLHCKLLPFATLWKKDKKPLYFVSIDIRSAFDSIPQEKLLTLVNELVKENEYLIRKYAVLINTKGQVKHQFKKSVSRSEDFCHFPEFATSLAMNEMKKAILIDQVLSCVEYRKTVLSLIESHVTENIVKIRNQFYLQKVGVAQGSILSSLFCGLFLTDFEKETKIGVEEEEGILLRFVDDFLLITSNREKANEFIIKTHKAGNIEGNGTIINPEKTLVNFSVKLNNDYLNRSKFEHGDFFPWCGYMFCTKSLNVIRNYSSLGSNMADNLVVQHYNSPGDKLLHKIVLFLSRKCSPAVLDCFLNSIEIVALNIYQIYLFSACQITSYFRHLNNSNLTFVESTCENSISLLVDIVHIKISTAKLNNKDSHFGLKRKTMIWLGNHAFCRILKRQHGRYHEIIPVFENKVKKLRMKIDKTLVDTVVNSNLNLIFDRLKL